MKKKGVFLAAGVLALAMCGLASAGESYFSWKEFYNAAGETVSFPVAESIPQIPDEKLLNKNESASAPERAQIGDVFLGEDGYERVIAVSKDGAFVSEVLSQEEEKMSGKEGGLQ